MKSMLEMLEATAVRVPDRIAFFDEHRQMTFIGLMERAKQIGSCLTHAAPPRAVIALLLDARSIENIPAMYGVLYAGCTYAPLDVAMPPARLQLMLETLRPALCLTDQKGEKALADCTLQLRTLSLTAAVDAEIEEERLHAVRMQVRPEDPMSILCTSGTTGTPKGSAQTHASFILWTQATIRIYGFSEHEVFANQSPFFYANSILEVFPPIALGASVYLLPQGVLTFPKRMMELLNRHQITVFCMTPSSFTSVVRSGVLETACLPMLRWGIMSGESMPWQPLSQWMKSTPNANWWHFYGSTEMFSVAVGKVQGSYRADDRLPVGKPFEEVKLLFLNEGGTEAPPHEPGEMYVQSPWVAQGYWRDLSRTTEAWIDDPLGRGDGCFYRSGDIGYLREDGELMVLGRKDRQIKHMGYRMELEELEAALRRTPGWTEGCVLHDKRTDRIFCFYTGDTDENMIRSSLKALLPRYMLPDVYLHLESMPYTATMKLDRNALKEMMT